MKGLVFSVTHADNFYQKCPGPNHSPVTCEVCHRQEGDAASEFAAYSCRCACNVLQINRKADNAEDLLLQVLQSLFLLWILPDRCKIPFMWFFLHN